MDLDEVFGKVRIHFIEMALTGQESTQAPHSVQVEASTLAVSSRVMALTGQLSTQAPQPVQVLASTTAGMRTPWYGLIGFLPGQFLGQGL
jgi:hypothetical protein